jgi:6-phosphogluconolactonase
MYYAWMLLRIASLLCLFAFSCQNFGNFWVDLPPGLQLTALSPAEGEVGQTVVLQGSGFSETISGNIVTFNAVQATVTEATATSLKVTVPTTTTGRVVVTNNLGTATSTADFAIYKTYVYVPNYTSGSVSGYLMNSESGVLAATPGSPYASSTQAASIVASPNGKNIYVAHINANLIRIFDIDPTTGALVSTLGTVPVSTGPKQITMHPSGNYLYSANGTTNNVSLFTVDSTTGALSASGSFAAGSGPQGIFAEPLGRFVYVANGISNNISAFTVGGGGALTLIGNFVAAASPSRFASDASGTRLYFSNNAAASIYSYPINATTGALSGTAVNNATSGNPKGIAINAAGTRIYAAHTVTANNVNAYSVDPNVGNFSLIAGTPYSAQSNPQGAALSPNEKFLIITNSSSLSVSVFAVDSTTGQLVQIPGSPFPTASSPVDVVFTRVKQM